MKKFKQNIMLTLALLLAVGATAQNQLFYVHEDQVKPSKSVEYRKLMQEFMDAAKKHNFDMTWSMLVKSNDAMLTIVPISNMADLDKNMLAPLSEKMGKGKLEDLYARMDKCYDAHGSYLMTWAKDLSYVPDNPSLGDESQRYRRYHYYYVKPENSKAMAEKIKAIKNVFESKKSKMNYRIFHSGLGTMGEYYVAVVPAANAEAYEKMISDNQKILGEEGKKAFEELDALTERYVSDYGYYLPQYSNTKK